MEINLKFIVILGLIFPLIYSYESKVNSQGEHEIKDCINFTINKN